MTPCWSACSDGRRHSESYQLLNTLYATTSGSYLHLDNETVRIEIERETRLRVPLHHLGGIVVFGDVLVSPALIARCADGGIVLTFLDRNGRFKARVEGSVSGNVLLRRAQVLVAENPDASLRLARQFVLGKLRNGRVVLQRAARESKVGDDVAGLEAMVRRFDASLRAAQVASDLDTLRGVEGEAARGYFASFAWLVRPDRRPAFVPDGRSRRPPRDAMNALLSFLYTLLTHDCRGALEAAGLDPQFGFLHVLRPGRPALALDLVEEFRSVVLDRLALTLINRRQVEADDFELREGGAVSLTDDGRKKVLSEYQKRKMVDVPHALFVEKVPLGLLPHVQARLLARCLRGDLEAYPPYAP